MAPRIDFWFDYVCPFSLVTRAVLTRVRAATGAEVVWHPFELHPHGVAEGGEYPRGLWQDTIRPLAASVGVELSGGPPGYPLRRTRLAFGGYQFALEQGCGDVYNNRVFDAYFEDWQDISDPVVLVRIATGIGLDGAAFRAALMSERYAARHLSAVAEAREKEEVLSCPTVAVGSWRASGVLGAEEIMAALRGMPDSGR